MRTRRVFEAVTLAIPFAFFACGGDKSREPSSAANTATYETSSPEPMPATESEPGQMTPASGQDTERMTSENERREGAAPEPAKAAALTDEQIAAVTDAAHGAEIDAAKLAVGKAKNARVRKFAQMMIDDHKKAKQDQAKLVTRLGLNASATSPKLEQFKTSAADTANTLKSAPADMFDKVYIDLQVADHQMMLDALDRDFIPSVQNAELKKSLEDIRPKVAHHLDQALEIQKTLMSAPSTKAGSSTSGSNPSGSNPSGTSGSKGTSGTGSPPAQNTPTMK